MHVSARRGHIYKTLPGGNPNLSAFSEVWWHMEARPISGSWYVVWLPTELASVEAKIEKKTPAHLFTQSYSPTTQGRGGLSTPTRSIRAYTVHNLF